MFSVRRAIFLFALSWVSSICFAQQISSSALISRQLDQQISSLKVTGGLLDVMDAIENQTSVRIEATQAVYDDLPWGEDTSISLDVKNETLRQVIDSMARHLGLQMTLGDQAVILQPTPALARLGRRATLDEIQMLDLLSSTPFPPSDKPQTVDQIVRQVDRALGQAKSDYAVQSEGIDSQAVLNIPRNASLMDALNLIADQTSATWYPWGQSIVVVPKVEAVRMLLAKRISIRFRQTPLQQVLLDLAEQSGTTFQMTPGVLRKVPADYANVTLVLDDATIDQALQSISGATGLKFTPQADGISVTFSGPATQP
ncbi:MAG TPA: hypothetical protein VMD30_07990 [Tepidisphaeraceae bacterium]|nr:hypothetical protein [Tepidisphaeraceae bacterium]